MKKKWTKEKCQEEALKYKTRVSYQKGSHSSYNSALKNNWVDEICSHMELLQLPNGYWTKEKCQEVALKYDTRYSFFKNDSGVYSKALKSAWLDDICLHMKPKKLRNYWTEEKCREVALLCESRIEFSRKYSRAYQLCLDNNWDVFSHMVCAENSYLRCIYAYEFSDKSVYVGLTHNLRKRNNQHLTINNNTTTQVYKHIQELKEQPNLIKLTEYIEQDVAKIKEGEFVEIYKNNGWKILNINKTGSLGGRVLKKK